MNTIHEIALTESETARRLGVSVSGLRKWRRESRGPKFIRLGRLIRYSQTELENWLAAHTVSSAATPS